MPLPRFSLAARSLGLGLALVRQRSALGVLALLVCATAAFAASTETLRVVTYNVEADTSNTTAGPGIDTVLESIGLQNVNGVAQPISILALQETHSNAVTVAPIVADLNSYYGAGTYAMSAFQGLTSGNNVNVGNGPNALIYNTTQLTLLQSFGLPGTLGASSGMYRQVIRYEFEPVGGNLSEAFYVYDSHYKSGSTSSDLLARNGEAQLIRADASTLGASARILYMGDFNTGASTEASYVTITASGQGQAFDPINKPGNWALNTTFQGILTESATNLRFRDDFILPTLNVMTDSTGLFYIPNSYHVFGNNGSTAINGNVNSGSNSALNGVPNAGAVLADLTTASDHLPVVADFSIPLAAIPEPAAAACLLGSAVLLWRIRARRSR